jgi:hyperosmotically inducible protein
MKKTIRNHPRSLLAVALSATLLFSAGQSMAQANEPEEKSTEAVNGSAQPVNDTWITTKVKADLLATENVSGLDIKVETVNGVVTLSGAVANKAQKDKAVEVATKIKGVTRVDSSGLTLASR